MARKPSSTRRPPVAAPTPAPVISPPTDVQVEQAEPTSSPMVDAPRAAEDGATVAPVETGPMRWLQMETGLSGPHLCLSRGDKHPFSDTPAADAGPSEAQRLIDAGFGVECDPPADA